VEALLQSGINVRCLVRPFRKNLDWISSLPIETVSGNLLEPSSIEQAIDDVDYVIHIAGVTRAKHRKDFFEGNVVATRNLLQIASRSKRLKKLCYMSSLTAVGPSPDGTPVDEQTPCRPITSYGRSKLEAEQLCHSFSARIPVVILRPPAVYGPRDKDVLELFKAAKFGLQPNVGSGEKTLSLVYGPDLAKAVVEATLSEKTAGKTYFVADPRVYSQPHIYDTISELVGSRSFRPKLPPAIVYSAAAITEFISLFRRNPAILTIEKARDLTQDHWVCSPESMKRDIGFEATMGADEGLKQTYLWYRDVHWI
jgi:nucleoside-diphosphate-sugar epimerase